ncbi:hypothetical protein BHE74_00051621 [Ensete ventricosum]|uniref:RanBP2-type domain-containing protein n=1 Tax=Ensete ventricosum TaxID=4639 RepID=A0A426X3W2_ENSVE|nr:hypothetical protein B296_00057306 [Ensete ventricosum]RWW42788.1 hypothetical protein BHE74_00051621 [Ensete ventricosum]RZS06224.1 hypothetical protein BHM03_00036852 [Ensete ventricosum]
MSRWPGDWNCWSCHHHNFSWRDSCQQCGNLRSSSGDPSYAALGGLRGESSFVFSVSDHVRPGDWYCSCGAHNFASRSNCHSCGASKDIDHNEMPGSQGVAYGGGGWKSGDWLCTRYHHPVYPARLLLHSLLSSMSCLTVQRLAVLLKPYHRTPPRQVYVHYALYKIRLALKIGAPLFGRSGCNQHNFASRRECYRCKTPKGCGK